MKTICRIKGGPPIEIDLEDLELSEAIALEDATGWTPPELGKALERQSMRAYAGLVWLILKRAGETVTYDDLVTGKYPFKPNKDIQVEPVQPDPPSAAEASASP